MCDPVSGLLAVGGCGRARCFKCLDPTFAAAVHSNLWLMSIWALTTIQSRLVMCEDCADPEKNYSTAVFDHSYYHMRIS